MKTILLLIIFTCYISNAQQSFVSTGSTISSPHGTMSYSIGQVSFISNPNMQVGIQQTYNDIYIRKIFKFWNIDSVYLESNLIEDTCILTVIKPEYSSISYVLFSVTGIKYMERHVTTKTTLIDFKQISEGYYVLKVLDGSTVIASFRIIKL
jgi:hypothetical protein